jgi:hypothetical protein
VGVSNLLASSRAISAAESENCENCVVKIVYFPVGLREPPIFLGPAIGTGHEARTQTAFRCEPAFSIYA